MRENHALIDAALATGVAGVFFAVAFTAGALSILAPRLYDGDVWAQSRCEQLNVGTDDASAFEDCVDHALHGSILAQIWPQLLGATVATLVAGFGFLRLLRLRCRPRRRGSPCRAPRA